MALLALLQPGWAALVAGLAAVASLLVGLAFGAFAVRTALRAMGPQLVVAVDEGPLVLGRPATLSWRRQGVSPFRQVQISLVGTVVRVEHGEDHFFDEFHREVVHDGAEAGSATMTVPMDASPTSRSEDRSVRWQVEVRGEGITTFAHVYRVDVTAAG